MTVATELESTETTRIRSGSRQTSTMETGDGFVLQRQRQRHDQDRRRLFGRYPNLKTSTYCSQPIETKLICTPNNRCFLPSSLRRFQSSICRSIDTDNDSGIQSNRRNDSTNKNIVDYCDFPSMVDVTALSLRIRNDVQHVLSNGRRRPKLVGVLVQPSTEAQTNKINTSTISNQSRTTPSCHRCDNDEDEEDQEPSISSSHVYSEKIQEALEEDGIQYELWTVEVELSTDTLNHGEDGHDRRHQTQQVQIALDSIYHTISRANMSDDVDGILVFYPIFPSGLSVVPKFSPSSLSQQCISTVADPQQQQQHPQPKLLPGVYYKSLDDVVRKMVHPSKDVEGLCGTTWFTNTNRNSNLNTGSVAGTVSRGWMDRTDHWGSSGSSSKKVDRNDSTKDATQSPFSSSTTNITLTNMVFPCTALSVQLILQTYHKTTNGRSDDYDNVTIGNTHSDDSSGFRWEDMTVSILNRSEIMGRPLASMLSSLGATVYSIDEHSILQFRPSTSRRNTSHYDDFERTNNDNKNKTDTGSRLPHQEWGSSRHRIFYAKRTHGQQSPESSDHLDDDGDVEYTNTIHGCLQQSDMVVTGIPSPEYQVPIHHLKVGTTLVNVSEFPNVCEQTLLHTRPDITYIPQVGKVTVACLQRNLIQLYTQKSSSS